MASAKSVQVAVLGLGNMGLPIASNLIDAGFTVHVYNRTFSKCEPLVARGAHAHRTAKEASAAVGSGGYVFTMLANDRALNDVSAELLEDGGMARGSVHFSMSTVSPDTTRALAKVHEEKGVHLIAAPVFGRPEAARAKRLVNLASGNQDAIARAEQAGVFAAIGYQFHNYGAEVGAANVAKLCGNFMIAATMETLGEASALAEKNGLDRGQVIRMLSGSLFACPVYQGYGNLIVERNHMPAGFETVLGLKDLTLVLDTAQKSNTPLPVAKLVHDRMLSNIAKGRGAMDWSAIGLLAAEDAGIDVSASLPRKQ